MGGLSPAREDVIIFRTQIIMRGESLQVVIKQVDLPSFIWHKVSQPHLEEWLSNWSPNSGLVVIMSA